MGAATGIALCSQYPILADRTEEQIAEFQKNSRPGLVHFVPNRIGPMPEITEDDILATILNIARGE